MKVYLCGPINACTDEECRDWRQAAKRSLPNLRHIDPMARDYRGQEDVKYREIVEEDKRDIDECDCLLVNYDKPSVGTSMEILYAWQQQKPIIVVAIPGTRISPWLRYHATQFLPTFQAAFRMLESLAGCHDRR